MRWGKRADGLYAAGIGGVVASIPRQVGEDVHDWCAVFRVGDGDAGVADPWTAHRTRTHAETFGSMAGIG